ncbi:SusC/RagA family TonB-linked outer membrane protein [Chryseobacterium sp. VAUSW3]|uniref:SusC/RagA family TonB-linked outer membrane protein n=1 Tax=Chryseobacterium sp. VAUSW3 TaxID=2010998 RepID=UPI000B4C71C6|nr:SusC/RagA family TonB-linked outer membrane protein [Chryseobacterium sp. VAUSW3]OWR14924.1 SusC/RagA family protein [Chryseobacterium sp. VAUSW3]
MRNYTKVLKIAPAFLLAGTMLHAQTTDSVKTADIEQVVLIGYGKQKKEDLTGSIASITAKDFNGGSTSADQLIQGKAPGVTVTGNGGNPGAGSTIRIRGGASLTASNDPLIVIDGIPMDFGGVSGASNALALINPNDIESFSVLKDASSAAIYGNRASNGVILITTKKGSSGRLKVNFTTTASVSTKMGNLDVLTADEFRAFVMENASQNYINKLGNANTNWQDLIYQEAWGTDNNVAISGGIKKLPYRLSLGYNEQNGIVKTNEFRRTSVGLNLTPKLFDNHLSITANVKGSMTENRFPAGVIGAAQYFDPTQPIYDYSANGNLVNNYFEWWLPNSDGTPSQNINVNATRNPLGSLYGRRDVSTVFRGIGSLQLDYKFHFLPDLHWNVNGGYDYQKGTGAVTEYPGYAGMIASNNVSTRRDYTQEKTNKLLDTYLNYVKDITAINTKVDLMAGYSYQNFHDLVPSATTFFGNATKPPVTSNNYEGKLTLLGFYGRAIFTIADKYIVNGSIRRDASSRFYNGTDDLTNVWGTFPAVSVAWKVKNESFLKEVNAISDLKLRAGWGETGQQEIGGYYLSFPSYNISESTAQYGFGDSFYFMYRPTQYNPNLTWETTRTVNAGIDYGFWNNRISGSIDWFRKNTVDLLANVGVPAGEFSNRNNKNIGEMETDGIEFLINVTPVKRENFTWDFTFNAAHYNPKIISFSDQIQEGYIIPTGGISGGVGNNVQGHSVGYTPSSFYVYQQVYDTNGKPLDGVYVDRNGDGKITAQGDKYFYKSTTPDATFGFSTKFVYKNWDFSTSLRAVIGNYVYNNFASQSNVQSIATNEYLQNISSTTANYGFATPQYWSDAFVEDASFLRMDNLSLGYNFGDIFGGSSNLKVYGMAQNVFVVTDYSGVDPEIFGNIDNGFYQRPKVYSLGLNFQF